MGSMIAPTLKLGIAVLSGGNAAVQQVQYLQYNAHNKIQVILLVFLGIPISGLQFTSLVHWPFLPLRQGLEIFNIMKPKIIMIDTDKRKKR